MKIGQLFILLLLSVQLSAQAEKEIRAALDAQKTAWNKGDLEGFMEHYWKSDSLRFMTKKGVTLGWQQTLDRYKKGYPDRSYMGKLNFTIYTVEELSNDAALVTGKWEVISDQGNQDGHFNLLFRKKAGKWVIVLDHTS